MMNLMVIFLFLATSGFAFQHSRFPTKPAILKPLKALSNVPHEHPVPLEIEKQLDPNRYWDVTFIYNGVEKTVKVPETISILESGNKIFNNELAYSCLNGVCITCACQILKGRDNVMTAVQSLGDPQIEAGFGCACQTFPTGPGIVIKLGTYDECYESQYGQFEKSYGNLKYGKK